MKNIKFMLLSVILMLCGSNVNAQSLKIYKNDGTTITVPYSELDRIETADNEEQPKYEYVDLGLSVKWATCNVGAEKPEQFGTYFSWGEIAPKSSYAKDNSVTHEQVMDDFSGNSKYDAARAILGGTYRMPTHMEMEELVNNCTWEWTTLNDVKGMRVTGTNGNSIFLPAAGSYFEDILSYVGEFGTYWSSTPYDEEPEYANIGAYRLDFYGNGEYSSWWGFRILGHPIRPVLD